MKAQPITQSGNIHNLKTTTWWLSRESEMLPHAELLFKDFISESALAKELKINKRVKHENILIHLV